VIESFLWVETLISLAIFLASMYSSKVVHFAVHGPEICPGNLGRNVKFPPPPEIPSLNPEILGAGNSAPRARISAPAVSPYKRGGQGGDTSWHLFPPPTPSLSKPPPPPHQGRLRRLPSRRNLRISLVLAPLGMGDPFLHAVFTMDDGIAPNLSP
jgi:hypothetical protein